MNWVDYVVLAIISGFGIIGLVNGFIFSVFRLVSFLISVVLSIKFYPVVANFLMKTALYTTIKASILKNLFKQVPAADSHAKQAAADSVINSLHLPGFLKGHLLNSMPNPSKLVDINGLLDRISGDLAKVVIDILSLVIIYIAIRVVLIFVRVILQGIAKLPLFRQVDKLGGFALGAVEGLLTIYIVCAVLMLFHAAPQFKHVFEALDNSSIAKFFYQNNFIVDWMFPKDKVL